MKFTWWASNSGPSTQTNFVSPPTVVRHPPHMPVPSIMIELRLTMVLRLWGLVTSATALIMMTGPMARTRSIFVFSSISRFSSSVTKPWRPYDPSSVVTNSLWLIAFISSSRMSISLFRAPMIEMTSFPAWWRALAMG